MNAPEPKVAVEPYLLQSRDASGVVTLTLNRPQQFNALSVEMMTALSLIPKHCPVDNLVLNGFIQAGEIWKRAELWLATTDGLDAADRNRT